MKKIILIGGPARSGKNQTAEFMQKHFKQFKIESDILSFAAGVKEVCRDTFSQVNNHINETVDSIIEASNKNKKIIALAETLRVEPRNYYEDRTTLSRLMLQTVGTDVFRNKVSKQYWIEQVVAKIKASDSEVFFLPDYRFSNEYFDLHELLSDVEHEMIAIRIEKNLDTTGKIYKHSSETSLSNFINWSYVIDNNADLKKLNVACKTVVANIIEGGEDEA